jgi:hypothetical protein
MIMGPGIREASLEMYVEKEFLFCCDSALATCFGYSREKNESTRFLGASSKNLATLTEQWHQVDLKMTPLVHSPTLLYYSSVELFRGCFYLSRGIVNCKMRGGGDKTMKKLRRNLKGISTIIATIIIVAIAIVMAIAVAYWVLGIGGSFTRFEKLEFSSAYAQISGTSYIINMTVRNTGSASATIDPSTIFYNGLPASAYSEDPPAPSIDSVVPVNPGNSTSFSIELPNANGATWVSGMNLEVMIQTTAGRQYPKVVTLP